LIIFAKSPFTADCVSGALVLARLLGLYGEPE
jgi:hypothetical protein